MTKYLFVLLALFIHTASAATQKGFETEVYGFLRASTIYSSDALASYNNINLSAPTHAAPRTTSTDRNGRLSFQTQQSRVGFNLKKGDQLSAKLEFDFIDFAKSSPTTQMNPRVRIAAVTYAWENQKVVIGQDWDLFSPVTSFTFDYVGLYFMAGNTGFMRQQLQYLNTQGNWEFGTAIGMAGNNPGSTENDLELGKSPSYSARASYALENGRMGASVIYSTLKYNANKSTHDAYGYNLFFEKMMSETSIKSEAYYGQNLANLGTLSIGKGTMNNNVKEYGATLTVSHKVTPKHVPFGGLGIARVDNKNSISHYTPYSTTAAVFPGVKNNFLMRAGWEYKVTDDFSWISELSRYETTTKLTANYQTNIATSVETGIQLRF